LHSIREVFTFENARDCVTRCETNEVFRSELRHPTAVEINYRFGGLENLEDLLLVRFGVLQNFVFRELLSRCRSAGWIADHSGKISDQENRDVSKSLEVCHL